MNATLQRLLPPQATGLERAVLEVAPTWDALADVGRGIDHIRPESFKPWLVAEWELAQFSPFFPSLDALLAAGLPWLMERGTAAAVLRVLGWLGFPAAQVEEDGAYLHIDLGRGASPEQLQHIAQLVRTSIPAHISFRRVYSVWDLRPLRLDAGRLDDALLDDDSGVWTDTDSGPVKVSIGQTHGGTLPRPATPAVRIGRGALRAGRLSYDDRPLLDAWRLDSQILLDAFGGLGALFSGTTQAPPLQGGTVGFDQRRSGQVPRAAQTPLVARKELRSGTTPVPVDPPRRWGGPWGGPWRRSYPLITYTES